MNEYISVRKIVLHPVEDVDRVYKYLRDGMYNQNRAYNFGASLIYAAVIERKPQEYINDLYNRLTRQPDKNNPDYSLYPYDEYEFPIGLNTASTIVRRLKKDMKTATKNGLFKGNVSLQNRKREAPLLVESRFMKFNHNCESHDDFLQHEFSNDLEITMDFVNNIKFHVVLGNPYHSKELRMLFERIFDGTYKPAQSSIQIDSETERIIKPDGSVEDKTSHKIVLNLSVKIPKTELALDENTVVGVDLGLAVPAVCALNNNLYANKFIGSADDFVRMRTKMQAQRERVQKGLRSTSGGHGYKKKMQALDRFKRHEENFVTHYNHYVSSRVVAFALKHRAKYINLEELTGFDRNKYILRNWSYYQLQQDITYKAERYGIVVRKINPYHTSQMCSFCGSTEKDQRKSQSEFVCKNPDCISHSIFKKTVNADFNAARNIAASTDFITPEEHEARKKGKASTGSKAKSTSKKKSKGECNESQQGEVQSAIS